MADENAPPKVARRVRARRRSLLHRCSLCGGLGRVLAHDDKPTCHGCVALLDIRCFYTTFAQSADVEVEFPALSVYTPADGEEDDGAAAPLHEG